ncbi:MAG: serine/threonine protein kinase, partial [Polyangiaceae bacterium]|nr:serine/threonine protein kinase [Polyangiaceae bacterium]
MLGASCPDDGWTQPAAPRAGPGASARPPVAAGFEVGEPLGAGGFAVVWAAARRADGAPAVVKVGRGATPVIVERFQREAAAMERVGPPHTPELHARGLTEDGRPYLVMERLSGETLAAWIARQRVPPAPEVVAGVAGPLLSALEAAHARGVIHRDLKPENVFLAGDARRAVLLDFGLARRTDAALAELTQSGVVVGTPDYMAPEQLAGAREACEPADVYAIGVVLFEMLTLRLPFEGEPAEVEHGHLALRPPRPSEHAHVPPALEELVLSCLAKEPERRPAGAAALRRALEAAAALPAAPPPRSSRAGAAGARRAR